MCCKIANSFFIIIILFYFRFLSFNKRIKGCWSTLTKARALQEGKKNILEVKGY